MKVWKLIKAFKAQNGRLPNGVELEEIRKRADRIELEEKVIDFPRSKITDWRKPRPTDQGPRVIPGGSKEGQEITEKLGIITRPSRPQSMNQEKVSKDLEGLMKQGLIKKGENVKKTKAKEPVDQKLVDDVKNREMFEAANKRLTSDQKLIKEKYEASNKIAAQNLKRKKKKKKKEGIESLDDTATDLFAGKVSLPLRLMKNFNQELSYAELAAEGYTRQQIEILMKAREILKRGDELNPNEALLRVKEDMADAKGIDVDELNIDFEVETGPIDYASGGRVRYAAGGINKMRRAFLKAMGAGAATGAAATSGLVSLLGKGAGKGAGKEVAKEVVKESTTRPPEYFFRLVEKIKFMGDDTLATKDKAIAKKYKDYTMEEDFAGNIEIIKKGDDLAGNKIEDVYMSYRVDEVPIKGKKGSTKVEEYEEFTARPDMEGKMKDVEPGVPDEVIEEAGDTTAMTLKKADGGRVSRWMGGGLSKGKRTLADLLKMMSKDSSHGKSPSEMLQMINPKQFNPMLDRPEGIPSIARDMIGKYTKDMKRDRSNMIQDLISTGRRIKKVDDDLVNYKIKIVEDMTAKGVDRATAKQMAETLAQMVGQGAGKKATPNITEQGLLELENIGKNLATKDRKLNASGGIARMLGE
tara:strand:- start:138 stop:2057 length:1920 start_codon:yes stop_codon:yes gene_type:complete